MNKKIEKIIINEVKSQLSEIDFDHILDPKRIKELVGEEIDREIIMTISNMIQSSILTEIKKKYPIIDSFVAQKVIEITHKIEEL